MKLPHRFLILRNAFICGILFGLIHLSQIILSGATFEGVSVFVLPVSVGFLVGLFFTLLYVQVTLSSSNLSVLRETLNTEKLAHSQSIELLEKLSLAVEKSPSMVIIMNQSGTVEYVNPQYSDITGYEPEEIIGENPGILGFCVNTEDELQQFWSNMQAGHSWHGEIRNKTKEGDEYWESVSVSPILNPDGVPAHLIVMKEDITEQKNHEQIIHFRAYHDVLTGLANRFMLYEVFALAKHISNINKQMFALLFLDIDNFKNINDTFGHHVGDELLKQVAERMKQIVGRDDIIFRWSGDEFIVFTDVHSPAGAKKLARDVLDGFDHHFQLDNHDHYLSASIGITLYPNDGEDINELLKAADLALASAKKQGRERLFFYRQEMTEEVLKRTELSNHLHKATQKKEFFLHYQPKVDLTTGRIIGCEALTRWNSPISGIISPAVFIPIAEENGLITQIGEWVLQTASAQMKQWKDKNLPPFTVAINLSSRQFREKNLVDTIYSTVKNAGLEPTDVELEITESIMMENVERTIEMLKDLHARGFKIAIDDFGTGYSSLRYLQQFPIDFLKIDRSFVIGLTTNQSSLSIVKAIIAMAKSMNIKLVAEGVDSMDQLQILKELECDYIQGFLFAKPLAPVEFEKILSHEFDTIRNA